MKINVNLDKRLGKIKDMNATGQAPLTGGMGKEEYGYFHCLSDVCVPYVRLHDVGGAFGRNCFVDIPNIFRNFDADENDPDNYDFTFTDYYIAQLEANGLKAYYRLGITIENHAEIKSYYTAPPKDYDKWARICEHIIAHYNEGWADGFHYGIEYWEIWNESDDLNRPDRVSQMWSGSAEDYYRLYDVASKHLKKKFPNIKIGGYAASGFYAITEPKEILDKCPFHNNLVDYFYGFMEYIKSHNSPIDFFSWHSYSCPKELIQQAFWVRDQLGKYGYGDIESHLNEWNPKPHLRGTGKHSADIAAIMLGCQNAPVDMLMIYDARMDGTTYDAFSIPSTTGKILSHGYYAFAAFSALYKLGQQIELTLDTEDVYAVCASNGEQNAIMISNVSGKAQVLEIEGVDLSKARWSAIDNQRLLSWSPAVKEIENNQVLLIEW